MTSPTQAQNLGGVRRGRGGGWASLAMPDERGDCCPAQRAASGMSCYRREEAAVCERLGSELLQPQTHCETWCSQDKNKMEPPADPDSTGLSQATAGG